MILLVRHGETTHHTEHMTGGWTDSALTEKGMRQMAALGNKLEQDLAGKSRLPLIWSSDLQRAADSAAILADKVGGTVQIKAFLREKNNGEAAGLSERAARSLYRRPVMAQDLDHRNYPGGETRREFFERTCTGMPELFLLDEREVVIVVAHKGTIQNIVFSWLGLAIGEVVKYNFSFDIRPSSLTVLGINKWAEHGLFLLNDTSHLAERVGFGLREFKYGTPER